jgi:hypothetical protein
MEEEKKDEPKNDEYAMLVLALQEVMSVKQTKVSLPPPPAATQPTKPASHLNSIINRLRHK